MEFLEQVKRVTNNIKWRDVERFCNSNNYRIVTSKKGYKVYINNSIWSVHLEHRTSDELKFGIIRELKKILVKEGILN